MRVLLALFLCGAAASAAAQRTYTSAELARAETWLAASTPDVVPARVPVPPPPIAYSVILGGVGWVGGAYAGGYLAYVLEGGCPDCILPPPSVLIGAVAGGTVGAPSGAFLGTGGSGSFVSALGGSLGAGLIGGLGAILLAAVDVRTLVVTIIAVPAAQVIFAARGAHSGR